MTLSFSRETALAWLYMLHGESPGYVHVCSTGDWTGYAFPTDDLEQASQYIEWLDNQGKSGIYVRATTLATPPDPSAGKRGGEEDSFTLPGLWADIDLAGPGHKTTKPLPVNIVDAANIISEARLPEPTLWIHSGGGLYPWWFIRPPYVLDNAEKRLQAQELSACWQERLGAAAQRLGFHYGTGVGDLSRVLRVPGTINRKEGLERPCYLIDGGHGELFEFANLWQVMLDGHAKLPAPAPAPRKLDRPQPGMPGAAPGDDFNVRADWAEILEPVGWQFVYQRGNTRYWVRPGKSKRDGISATTGHAGDGVEDRIFVFSDATDFTQNEPTTKFGAFALMHHGGDHSAAAKELRRQGYGAPPLQQQARQSTTVNGIPEPVKVVVQAVTEAAGGGGAQGVRVEVPIGPRIPTDNLATCMRSWDDPGNAERVIEWFGQDFRWVRAKTSHWSVYDGRRWIFNGADTQMLIRARFATDIMKRDEAELYDTEPVVTARGVERPSQRERFIEFMTKSRHAQAVKRTITMVTSYPEVHVEPNAFDSRRELFNLHNGVLNTDDRSVGVHDASHMLSRISSVPYDPAAKCPQWNKFLEDNLPDPEVRDYIQRAVGYALTGRSNAKKMWYLYGVKDTGKTLFVETIAALFGEYGYTAAEGMLRPKRAGGPTNDEDGVRGKRFVTTSETRPGGEMDEALIKRLTGGDTQTTRDLYVSNTSWRPECTIWVASNQYPKVTGDDDAIWERIRVVPFRVQFLENDPRRDERLNEKLAKELPGILNWALEGLASYEEMGLAEPHAITTASEDFRSTQDGVQRFLAEGIEDGQLKTGDSEQTVRTEVHRGYLEWCKGEGIQPLNPNRFYKRLETHGFRLKVIKGFRYIHGLTVVQKGRWIVSGQPALSWGAPDPI